jgi:hypothetical protein
MNLSPDSIEAEYERLGHQLGWRLLTCPWKNIGQASVALITINPGGGRYENAQWSVEEGSAYVVESWKGQAPGTEKLQRQVRRMFRLIGIAPSDILSGYLVPFRSRSWGDLPKKPESLHFGKKLWREILAHSNIRTVFAFGKDAGPHVASLFGAKLEIRHEAGWGTETIDRYCFGRDGVLIVLPHLSRFGLFGRARSEAAFLEVIQIGNSEIAGEVSEPTHARSFETSGRSDATTKASKGGDKSSIAQILTAVSLFGAAAAIYFVGALITKNSSGRK